MTLTQIHYVITIAETKSMNKAVFNKCDQRAGKGAGYHAVFSQWQGCDIDKRWSRISFACPPDLR